jgi:CheY-like chemotaxis protein
MNLEQDVLNVRNSICDHKDLLLFNALSTDKHNNRELLAIKSNLSKKEYYSRLSKFIRTSLIEGTRGQYCLTSLGVLVKEMLKILEIALQDYSALRPIDDSAESQRGRIALIDLLIDNPTLKSLIIQGYSHLEETNMKAEQFVRTKQKHPINIIMVEEDLDTLRSLEVILKGNGFTVKGFVNPYQALNYFIQSDHNCRLVISDIRLPQLNGIKLCQKMNKIDANLKVLYITGLDVTDEIVSTITDINLVGVLKKPILEEDLITVIRNIAVR